MMAMRELSDDFKLSVRTIAEVSEALGTIIAQLGSDKSIRLKEKGKVKKPTRAALVSALILYLARLPKDEQRAMIAEGIAEVNRLLEHDSPQPLSGRNGSDAQIGRPLNPVTGDELPRPGRSRKSV